MAPWLEMSGETFSTDVPQRLDRLPWSGWHTRVVLALGITWILDGLEVTIVGALGAALTKPAALGLRESQVGSSRPRTSSGRSPARSSSRGSPTAAGGGAGSSSRSSSTSSRRSRTAFAWDLPIFLALRFLTGAGIGGEYAAINSAIDELIPARCAGRSTSA